MDRKTKGNIAELKAMEYLVLHGYVPYRPIFDNAEVDLVAVGHSEVLRVGVRYASALTKCGKRYRVELRNISRRRNNEVHVKKFERSKFDRILVYIAPEDRIVELVAGAISGETSIEVPVWRRD